MRPWDLGNQAEKGSRNNKVERRRGGHGRLENGQRIQGCVGKNYKNDVVFGSSRQNSSLLFLIERVPEGSWWGCRSSGSNL